MLPGTDVFLWGTPLKPQGPDRSNTSSWAWSNTSGKFPISCTSAQRSHALRSQSGFCFPAIPPVGDLPGPLSHPCHHTARGPLVQQPLAVVQFPLGKVSLQWDFRADTAERATTPAGTGHAWLTGTQCLPSFPRCWPGQPGSINTPARGLAARRSQAAPVPVTAGTTLPARAPRPGTPAP